MKTSGCGSWKKVEVAAEGRAYEDKCTVEAGGRWRWQQRLELMKTSGLWPVMYWE